MLNGLDPVFIFQFSALAPSADTVGVLSDIPVISQVPTLIEQPPIPIYLSENLTGLFIESEDKNVDIETDVETKTSGTAPDVNQKGVSSVVTINLVGKKDSIGLMLLSAMVDLVFDKVTSKEYAISYLSGATTIFRGLLHSFSVNQTANDERLLIKIEISKGEKQPVKVDVTEQVPGLTDLQTLGAG